MTRQIPYLVICGTDTDIGKTIISALIVQGLNASYWKPIQSGLEDGGDRGRINKLINLSHERSLDEVYKFKAPVSPHWAAEQENCLIDIDKLSLPQVKNLLVIETAGGLMVPLTREYLQIELLRKWSAPVVLVTRSGLGTLNHTLLSIEALRQHQIPLLGLIINGPIHPDNPKTLERFGQTTVIAEIPHLQEITAESLGKCWENKQMGSKLEKAFQRLNRQ